MLHAPCSMLHVTGGEGAAKSLDHTSSRHLGPSSLLCVYCMYCTCVHASRGTGSTFFPSPLLSLLLGVVSLCHFAGRSICCFRLSTQCSHVLVFFCSFLPPPFVLVPLPIRPVAQWDDAPWSRGKWRGAFGVPTDRDRAGRYIGTVAFLAGIGEQVALENGTEKEKKKKKKKI